MRFAAIADWADSGEFEVRFMCRMLEVSPAGYYRWRGAIEAGPAPREVDDARLIAILRELSARAWGNPGVRRLRAGLAAVGCHVSHKRVHRLMQVAGLRGRHPRAWKRTTTHGQAPVGAPDLIGRDFTATGVNQRWCGDITYIQTWDGWAYLATVIDLHSRTVVGWAVADHMRTSLVTDALMMALTTRRPPPGVIFHSDRGTQYTSAEFADFCSANGIRRSMGRTGVCWDNAVAESFFATYKKELIHTRPWPTLKVVRDTTRTWIRDYYNTTRRHSTLGYLTPLEYEIGYRHINQLAA